MTLKVVGANPTIYPMLPAFFNTKQSYLTILQKISRVQLRRRNIDYAHEWVYEIFLGRSRRFDKIYLRKRVITPQYKFFCKRTNQNKLYSCSSKKLFISPGIIVRYVNGVNGVQLKFLKKKSKTWANTLKILLLFMGQCNVFVFDNLFGKKEILLKRLVKRRALNSWFIFNLFFLNYGYSKKPKRRIKRWIKKKYYRLSINENK